MFSCDFFSIFSHVWGPFCVTKSAGPGSVAPLKTATDVTCAFDLFVCTFITEKPYESRSLACSLLANACSLEINLFNLEKALIFLFAF